MRAIHVAFSLFGRRLSVQGDHAKRVVLLTPAARGKNMRPRILLIAASLVLFPLALISGRAMALDVQKSCESEFKRYCGSYEAYSTSGERMHEIDGKITPTKYRLSASP